MRKVMMVAAAMMIAVLGMASTASAQDPHIGTVTSDPQSVPEAGEHTLTATGSDFLPDTSILVAKCVSPADTLVPGTSTADEITAAALAIEALRDCDVGAAIPVDVDADGGWEVELTAEVGDNFFLSAGALDGSQSGATWVPIVPAGAADLPETGAETGLIAVVGATVVAAGALVVRESRRLS